MGLDLSRLLPYFSYQFALPGLVTQKIFLFGEINALNN
jgi:hypothetical protein